MKNHRGINKEELSKKIEDIRGCLWEVSEIQLMAKRPEIELVKELSEKKIKIYFNKANKSYIYTKPKEIVNKETKHKTYKFSVKVLEKEEVEPKSVREALHNIEENRKYVC